MCPYNDLSVGRLNALKRFGPDDPASDNCSWIASPELKREALSKWGKTAIKRRMEQEDDLFSTEKQSKRGRQSAQSRNQGIFLPTIHNNSINIAANGRISLFWVDEENNGEQKKLDLTYYNAKPTKSYKAVDLEGIILFTKEGIVLKPHTNVNPPISISVERLDSLQDNQDLIRLWQVEVYKQFRHLGETLLPKRIMNPKGGGKLYPSVKTTSIDIASIKIEDSLYILKSFCKTIPPNTRYISMIPEDWKDSYLKKKFNCKQINNVNEVLFFETVFRNYIEQNFKNHPRFGESLYKVNNFSDTNAGHSKQFLLLIQLLCKDTRQSMTVKFAFYHLKKSRAFQELQFL